MPSQQRGTAHTTQIPRLTGGSHPQIRGINLKPAVTRILLGRDRVEHERFIALRAHYLLTELTVA